MPRARRINHSVALFTIFAAQSRSLSRTSLQLNFRARSFSRLSNPLLHVAQNPQARSSSVTLHRRMSSSSTDPSVKISDSIKFTGEEDRIEDVRFGKFIIPAASVFFRSPKGTAAFVNLRPIVPGHVLVIPSRVVPKMKDMTEDEYLDMWATVRLVQSILTKQYETAAFNVAVQDGQAAGQSIPHVHVHVLPRQEGDYERNDDIYTDLEEWAPRKELKEQSSVSELEVPDDSERRDRTRDEMANEAESYRKLLASVQEA